MAQKSKSKGGVKKSFYDVEAPMTAIKISLYGSSQEEFDGKAVILDLTKSLRGKNLLLKMKVKYQEGKLIALPVNVELAGSFIRRAMRRGSDYVEDSFEAECRDAFVTVKPFLITRMRVSRAVRKALRDTACKYIKGYVRIRTTKEIFSEIIANKVQKGMAIKLKKIYPLALCEIRVFEIKREKSAEESAKDNTGEEFKEEKIESSEIGTEESAGEESEEKRIKKSKKKDEEKDDSEDFKDSEVKE